MDALVQVAIQVPAFALFCLVAWKLGTLAITKWSEGDNKRTEEISKGFAAITSYMAALTAQLARLDEKLDLALDIEATLPKANRRK